MKNETNRIVITGIGIVTPLGLSSADTWESILQKKHNFTSSDKEIKEYSKVPLVGLVENEPLIKNLKSRKMAKYMGKDALLAVKSAGEALTDANWDQIPNIKETLGLYVGTGVSYSGNKEFIQVLQGCINKNGFCEKTFGESGLSKINPLWSFQTLSNMSACNVSIEFGLKGDNLVFNLRSEQASNAFTEAFHALKRGQLDYALVGATETNLHIAATSLLDIEKSLYTNKNFEKEPIKPFDKNRNGIIPSEGGAFLFMEKLESAKKRNAKIYAEVLGYGKKNCTSILEQDLINACIASIKNTFDNTMSKTGNIDLFITSAGGYKTGDKVEGTALSSVFDNENCMVWSPKAFYGDMGVGSVTTSIALGAMAIKSNKYPENIGTKDCEFRLNLNSQSLHKKKLKTAMISVFSVFGAKSNIILRSV